MIREIDFHQNAEALNFTTEWLLYEMYGCRSIEQFKRFINVSRIIADERNKFTEEKMNSARSNNKGGKKK